VNDDTYIKACARSGLPTDGRPFVVSLLGKKVGIFRRGEEIYALEMSCKHQGADLSKGLVERGIVTCPRHGWRYDLKTGECVEPQPAAPLRFHVVKIVGEEVWVSMRPLSPAGNTGVGYW